MSDWCQKIFFILDLNTSYVKVQWFEIIVDPKCKGYLNTSYVKVQFDDWQKIASITIFKYILC